MRARSCIAAALMLAALRTTASAAPLPPPDPRRGERYDGRVVKQRGFVEELMVVPRLALRVPRLVLHAAYWPIERAILIAERYRVADRVMAALTSEDGTRGIRPEAGYLLSFRPTVGFSLFDRSTLGGGRSWEIIFATGGPSVVELTGIVLLTGQGAPARLELRMVHRMRDDWLFTGLDGSGAPARYGINMSDATLSLGVPVIGPLSVGARVAVATRSFFDGAPLAGDLSVMRAYCARDEAGKCMQSTVDEALIPGFERGTRFVRVAGVVHVDNRDSAYRPTRGVMLDVTGELTRGLRDGESFYGRVIAQAQGVIPVGRSGQALVLAVRGDQMLHLGGPSIPFFERITLGGPHDLRGARPGRFRGLSALIATIEYRWPIWMWADATLFADTGTISDGWFGDPQRGRFFSDVGFGFRVTTRSNFILRIQIAYGFGGDGLQTLISAAPGL